MALVHGEQSEADQQHSACQGREEEAQALNWGLLYSCFVFGPCVDHCL